MKLNQGIKNYFLSSLLAVSLALLFAGCSGGSSGSSSSGGGSSGATTTVAGKVTLSSTVSGKPALMKAMLNAPKGKPGSKAYKASLKASSPLKSATLAPALSTIAFANGDVYLYNSDHPEWLCPVSTGKTATDGSYSLSKLTGSLSTGQTYAACNGGVYNDGDDIPAGNYTLMAFKAGGFDPLLGKTTNTLVAVQTIVNSFSGAVTLSDMEAQEGTSYPTVAAILGAKQNTDGTQTWGSSATTLPANAAIQINFSAAMSRGSLTNGITISPAVSGKWALSADWTTATFYPNAGVTLTPGTVYTVTVKGADTDSANAVRNVYANALAKTATGTFKATAVDTVAPTTEWESPTTIEMATAVDVTKPIRIRSNKALDVNSLALDGKVGGISSLGAKPGVLFVEKNTAGYYVYEFILGVPLKLNTTYDLTVSGGKGLNGIAMAQLNGSLMTVAVTAGVDSTASAATQEAQAAVKDVFGKWMRSFSDRNITQLQSLMSGDFYFEDPQTDPKSDLNHDGRLNLGEFTSMLSNQAFPNWEYCQATITGDVLGTINVVGNNADFQFQMNAATTNTSQNCVNTVPTDPFYVTIQNVNGAWTVVRTSVGIDTRTKTINFPNMIDGLKITQGTSTITDGGLISLPMYNPLTFSWSATTGVSSYVVLGIDARDPEHGFACALPTTATSFDPNSGCMSGVDVSSKFGFAASTMATPGPFWVEGGQYYWEVIGLGTITATSTSIGSTSKTPLEIQKDITAISALQSVNVAGVYKEITAQVYGGTTATGTPVTYSVIFDGYDVGNASQATITVTTPNTAATSGDLYVSGNFYKSYPLAFNNGVATVTVDLSKGSNWINVSDWLGLNKSFSINTTGGIPKTVAITSVADDKGGSLTPDSWGYVKATAGATKVTISGTVDTTKTSTMTVDVNVWNDTIGAYSYVSTPVTGGAFNVTLDIYKGDNWINVYSYDATSMTEYYDYAGVYTDTGTVWVPNISVTAVTTAIETSSYGQSSDWDASTDSDGIVTITGKFKNPVNGSYSISSDGGWSNGTLNALADGSFSLNVTLYNGWNYVSFSDVNYNWYGVNIYTTNGKLVVKPTIATVNGVAPVVPQYGGSGAVSTSTCTATVTGTATAGNLNVSWNGYDGTTYYYESQTLNLSGAAETPIAFSFSVPLVSGTGSYNNIDVYDASYKWTGVQVTTSTTCAYTQPAMTLDAVLNSAGAAITPDMYDGSYPAGASPSITLSGTSNRAGRSITVSTSACTAKNYYATASSTTNASGTYDWLVSIPVYEGYNYPSASDGTNWFYPTITSTNGALAPAALTASISPGTVTYTGTCGYQEWDVGNATSVSITGTTTAPDGTGNYTDAAGGSHTFTISGGAYNIANVPVYDGWNSIYLYDNATNSQSVYITAANGNIKPKFVDITAPLNTDTLAFVTGPQTVSGTMLDPTGSGYKPPVVRASVSIYDSATGSYTYTYYSSDPYDQTYYGDSAMSYDSTTGAFSFSADFGTGGYSYVDVYGYDNLLSTYHSMTKYYNDGISGSNGTTVYYKPGTKTKAAVNPAVESELMKQRLMSINRNR